MSEQTEPWTVRRVLTWATTDLRDRGIDAPRLDAELLLCKATGLDRVHLIIESQRPLSPRELSAYRELHKRRRAGEPTAYLLGEREFWGLRFRVDRRVLIPRPDTEALVEVALERTRHLSMHGRALDLCTGSGCVAIAFHSSRPTWETTAIDLDEGAAEVARRNALRLGAIVGFHVLTGDTFAPLPGNQRFDLITANPPYIRNSEIPGLQREIREFEPHLALDGGTDGLTLARRIIAEAPKWLQHQGVLALEIGDDQAPAVVQLLEAAGFTDIQVRQDYGGRDRVVSGVH